MQNNDDKLEGDLIAIAAKIAAAIDGCSSEISTWFMVSAGARARFYGQITEAEFELALETASAAIGLDDEGNTCDCKGCRLLALAEEFSKLLERHPPPAADPVASPDHCDQAENRPGAADRSKHYPIADVRAVLAIADGDGIAGRYKAGVLRLRISSYNPAGPPFTPCRSDEFQIQNVNAPRLIVVERS